MIGSTSSSYQSLVLFSSVAFGSSELFLHPILTSLDIGSSIGKIRSYGCRGIVNEFRASS
jgi:hypothetical protein